MKQYLAETTRETSQVLSSSGKPRSNAKAIGPGARWNRGFRPKSSELSRDRV